MNQTVIKTTELTPSQRKALKFNFRLNAFIKDLDGRSVTTYIKPSGTSATEFHMQTNDSSASITLVIGKRGKIDSTQVVAR